MPLLCHFIPVRSVLFLLCCPLGKLPLPFLALEKCLYLRVQDTGQGLHLVIGYPDAVAVDFSFPRHRNRPGLELPLCKMSN